MLLTSRHSDRSFHRIATLTLIVLASFPACSQSPEPNVPSPSAAALETDLTAESAAGLSPDSVLHHRARVREAKPGRPVVESIGTVEALTRDSVRLDTDRGVRRVALGPTVRLEISRGIHANTGRGAWLGAFIGGVGAGIAGALSCTDRGSHPYDSPSACAVGGALLGGGGGALIGLAVGALVKTERWETVYPDPGVLPRPDRSADALRSAP